MSDLDFAKDNYPSNSERSSVSDGNNPYCRENSDLLRSITSRSSGENVVKDGHLLVSNIWDKSRDDSKFSAPQDNTDAGASPTELPTTAAINPLDSLLLLFKKTSHLIQVLQQLENTHFVWRAGNL